MSDLIEFPDAVIVQYIDRLKALSPFARKSIERPMDFKFSIRLLPFVLKQLWTHLALYGLWQTMIRNAIGSDNLPARVAYHQLFEYLKAEQWTHGGRAHAAMGLVALRNREKKPADAIALYRLMEPIIPRASIGWIDRTAA